MTFLLTENEDHLLLETGDSILLDTEVTPPTPIPDEGPPVSIYRLPSFDEVTVPAYQHAISGQRVKNEAGSGQFSIPLDDPAYALIEPHLDVMAFRREGQTVHSCIVEQVDEHTIDEQGGARETATYQGRGTGIALDWCPILPRRGGGSRPVENDTVYDWRSWRYTDLSAWVASTALCTVDQASDLSAGSGLGLWPTQPMAEDFTFGTGAAMLWASSGSVTEAEPGWCLFRFDIDITVPGRHGIEVLMDNAGLMWVDTVQELEVNQFDGYHRVSFKRLDLSEGVHTFAFAVRNIGPDAVTAGPAALAFNLFKTDQQDRPARDNLNAELPPLKVSDTSVQILEYPDDWPTLNVGQILEVSLAESQGYDLVPWITPTFDDVNDSNGDPWPQIGEGTEGGVVTKTGTTTIYGLLTEMVAAGHVSRWRVRPDGVTWDAWAPGFTSRPGDVELEPSPINDPLTGQVRLLDRKRT